MKGVLLSLALVVCVMVVDAKHCKKHRHEGCRLFKGRCTCEVVRGCHNPFPYNTEKECLDDAKGLNDQCAGHPCDNGVCVQVKHGRGRGWYCECAGTGFYGKQCQHQCPKGLDPMDPRSYPTACVMTDGINSGLGL